MKNLMKPAVAFLLLSIMVLCLLPGHFSSIMADSAPPELPPSLDLPDGFGESEEMEEEEIPLIEIYEETYEGDAFFFCLDRSSSMGNTTSSGAIKFGVLKREVIQAIQAISREATASVVFYDHAVTQVYGDPPIKMDLSGKVALINKVQSTEISRGSCLVKGLLKTLELATRSDAEHPVIILVADGRTHCSNTENDPEKVFNMIMQKNPSRIPINTIYTGPQTGTDWTIGKALLERLSRATNGKFKIAL